MKPWKSSHFPALRFHDNGRLSDFLPSCLPLLIVYKYWQNPADSVSLNPSSFCAPFFCLIFFVSLFYILLLPLSCCGVDDCYAGILIAGHFNLSSDFWFNTDRSFTASFVLWCGWFFWLLWFLIEALSFGSILTNAVEIPPIDYQLIYMNW